MWRCFFLLGWRGIRFTIAGYWVILYWAAWDLWGVFSGAQASTHVAYAAHVGGLLAGIVLDIVFVLLKLVKMDQYDNPTLPEYLKWVPMGYSDGYFKGRQSRPAPAPAASPAVAAARRPASLPLRPEPQTEISPVMIAMSLKPTQAPEAPAHTETYSFECPHCAASLELEGNPGGTSLTCPSCQGVIEFDIEENA